LPFEPTFRRSLSKIENEREEIVRSIAARNRWQDVPRHLLTKDNMGRFAAAALERLRGEDATLTPLYGRVMSASSSTGSKPVIRKLKLSARQQILQKVCWAPDALPRPECPV